MSTVILHKGKPLDISQLGGWIVSIILVIIGGVIGLLPKRGAVENQIIVNQKERIDSLEDRVDKLEPMLITYQRRDIAWEKYVALLIVGFERGIYPPWPDLPKILNGEDDD